MAAIECEVLKRDPKRLERFKEQYRRETGQSDMNGLTTENLDPRSYEILAARREVLSTSLEFVMAATPLIQSLGWTFAITQPPHYFATSDYPICAMNFRSQRIDNPGPGGDVELTVPLSSTVALVANRRTAGTSWAHVPPTKVEEINLRSAYRAAKFVVAPKDSFPGWETIRASLEEKKRGRKPNSGTPRGS